MINVSKSSRKRHGTLITRIKRELRNAELKRWVIKYSWKHGYPKGDPSDWRSWRSFAVVPILFRSEEEARNYINAIGFKNLTNLRKCSVSIEVKWLASGQKI